MRLLKYAKDGGLTITEFSEDAIPPYAILSHRWGEEADEVTFEDLESNARTVKPGYEKIRFCGEQVRQDDLLYFWIDTCCIDKTDKAELSYAIRSMFRWYQNANKCYVYLSDVSTRRGGAGNALYEFRSSQWFTRGWTLQELLAPSIVEFFSREWKKLGDKMSLKSEIHRITSIPQEVLEGVPLSRFSVSERFRWRQNRQTQLKEDGAYSLSGILDVDIAPVYGEGAESAFRRLHDEVQKLEQCIRDLRPTDPRDDKERIEDTKGGLLRDAYCWVLENANFQQWYNNSKGQSLWVKGDPGKGKTMLLCGIINELQTSTATTALVSYFFCQATDPRINNATAVLRGLLYLLVKQQPSLASHVRKKHDDAGKALFEDANAWVALIEIFTSVLGDPSLNTTYLIIDALDECVTGLPKLLDFLVKQWSSSSRAKWIVSSRNWPSIEERLERAGHKTRLSLELNAESVSAAVGFFIQRKVSQLAQQNKYGAQIQNAVLEHLMSNADNTFLWVSLVCQNLQATARRNVLKKLESFPPGLDALYQRMMQQISNSDDAELCKQILASIALTYRPITREELVALVEELQDIADDPATIREIVGLCGSFLTMRIDTIYFVHQSAKDFLLTQAAREVFPLGKEAVHHALLIRSLEIISRTLHRDMFSLKLLGHFIDDVEQPDPDPLAASRYSCTYWIDHLYDSKPISSAMYEEDLQDGGVVDVFLQKKYLYWLEALSLCKSMTKGVVSIAKLQSLVQGRNEENSISELVHDARRFIMSYKGLIESYPLQVYVSALLFSPTKSLVRRLFQHEAPEWIAIKPDMADIWSACLQTLEGHSQSVTSVTFSHDSTWLASASYDRTIRIWDAGSGACLRTLEGHRNYVNSVAFSHDSTWLASASNDNTIKIWDTSSGVCLQTLEGHTLFVRSLALSHDSTWLASASWDRTVKMWDSSSGICVQTLEGHSDDVRSVAFSHDSIWLASASASHESTVKIWDTGSGTCLQTLRGHSHGLNSVVFSHDSTWLASASNDSTIKIWDVSSGTCLQTLEGNGSRMNLVVFSHDSTQLAAASGDKTVKIWDTSSSACLQTLESHSSDVNSVAFSHNSTQLASASWDSTVKIWDTNTSAYSQMLERHSRDVYSVAFSNDSNQLASASSDGTVKIWNVSSGVCLQTLKGYGSAITKVAFSHDSTWLASGSMAGPVKIWDVRSGVCLQTIENYNMTSMSLAFSHDSTQLASTCGSTIQIWDTSSGVCLQTFEGHSFTVMSIAFSHDSTLLASGSASHNITVKTWDVSSGTCLHTLEGHTSWISSVAFSHDSNRLASGSDDGIVKIWDASNGTCLQTLDTMCRVSGLAFDPRGSYLYTDMDIIPIAESSHSSTAVTKPQQTTRRDISCNFSWIIHNAQEMLWLPPEYRPYCLAASARHVGTGMASGLVWIYHLV